MSKNSLSLGGSWTPPVWERKNIKEDQEKEMKQGISKWLGVKDPAC